jgi:hypothetical protein
MQFPSIFKFAHCSNSIFTDGQITDLYDWIVQLQSILLLLLINSLFGRCTYECALFFEIMFHWFHL